MKTLKIYTCIAVTMTLCTFIQAQNQANNNSQTRVEKNHYNIPIATSGGENYFSDNAVLHSKKRERSNHLKIGFEHGLVSSTSNQVDLSKIPIVENNQNGPNYFQPTATSDAARHGVPQHTDYQGNNHKKKKGRFKKFIKGAISAGIGAAKIVGEVGGGNQFTQIADAATKTLSHMDKLKNPQGRFQHQQGYNSPTTGYNGQSVNMQRQSSQYPASFSEMSVDNLKGQELAEVINAMKGLINDVNQTTNSSSPSSQSNYDVNEVIRKYQNAYVEKFEKDYGHILDALYPNRKKSN